MHDQFAKNTPAAFVFIVGRRFKAMNTTTDTSNLTTQIIFTLHIFQFMNQPNYVTNLFDLNIYFINGITSWSRAVCAQPVLGKVNS